MVLAYHRVGNRSELGDTTLKSITLSFGPLMDQFIGLEVSAERAEFIAGHEYVKRGDNVFRKAEETETQVIYLSVHPIDVTSDPA